MEYRQDLAFFLFVNLVKIPKLLISRLFLCWLVYISEYYREYMYDLLRESQIFSINFFCLFLDGLVSLLRMRDPKAPIMALVRS